MNDGAAFPQIDKRTCNMRIGPALLTLLMAIFATSVAYGDDNPKNGCIEITPGKVFCAPPGGSIEAIGIDVLCGPGQCVNRNSHILCSSQPNGAVYDSESQVLCVGGCVQANVSYCQIPHK